VRLWENSWAEFVPILEYDLEVRRVIATTNAIESINALKCLYLVTRSLDPTGGGRARWMVRWKPALNAFAITFAGRLDRAIH
jgi:putative transposase